MDSKTIRLINFGELADKYKRIIDFCEQIDMNPSYFSQVKNGKKSIGDDIARKIEKKLGLPHGYMDLMHSEEGGTRTPPDTGSIGLAYSIDALPAPLREQFKKLVYQMAIHCTTQQPVVADIQPFRIVTENEHDQHNQIPAKTATGQ